MSNKENNIKLFDMLIKENKLSRLAYESYNNYSDFHHIDCSKSDIVDEEMKISVVMATYNRFTELEQALHNISIQSYKNYEIVVVDDNSSFDLNIILKKYKDIDILCIRNQSNQGASKSREIGYENTTGDIIIFSDDDDYYIDENLFFKIVSCYKNKDCIATCMNTFRHYEIEDKYVKDCLNMSDKISTQDYLNGFGNVYLKPNSSFSLSVRKTAFDSINLTDEYVFNDTSLFLRSLISDGFVYIIDDYCGVYRLHSSNMTGSVKMSFIIENLKSKFLLYKYAENIGKLVDGKKWLYNQFKSTISYYFCGKINDKSEIKMLKKWIRTHLSGRYSFFMNIWISITVIKKSIAH